MEPHKGSQETYDFISKWVAPNFFFSRKDEWNRMGMLGVFGDYVLSCTNGDILEIGVGESSVYLTALAKKYNRRIYHCDISASKIENPLTVPGYLSHIYLYLNEKSNRAVESYPCILFAGASDDFFKMVDFSPIALAFIDGDHIYEQVKKDFLNVLPLVMDHGYIILHDTYPPSEDYLDENHCGGAYKLRQEIEKDGQLDCITLSRGTAMGVGMTIVRKKPKEREHYQR